MSKKRRDHHIARRLALRAYHRQGGLCFWCKQSMLLTDPLRRTIPPNPRLMTADHVLSIWHGGRTHPGNIVAACYECNHGRSGEANQTKRGSKITIGDDTPRSPFARLRERYP